MPRMPCAQVREHKECYRKSEVEDADFTQHASVDDGTALAFNETYFCKTDSRRDVGLSVHIQGLQVLYGDRHRRTFFAVLEAQ